MLRLGGWLLWDCFLLFYCGFDAMRFREVCRLRLCGLSGFPEMCFGVVLGLTFGVI